MTSLRRPSFPDLLVESPAAQRSLPVRHLDADLCVVGGGLSGVCTAITAARAGLDVVLMQDRPVLGGNASSEVRLWTLGATSHMGNNNRWAREGGVIDEILVENLYRNPEGNPLVLDALLLEKVTDEARITLLLDTAAHEVRKSDPDRIESVRGFCSLDGTLYEVCAPLFADCSGDGVIGFLSGAAFRIGQESRSEFGEPYAPERSSRELLGHSIYFMSRDAGRPVTFVPPSFALDMDEVRRIHRYRGFEADNQGCMFWWIEFGGHLDTVHDSRAIKWELWRVAYGVWNYIKNSGAFPEAANLTLDWVGPIPGKRESRRFEGDTVVVQQDLVEQRSHPDVVSFGGWAMDHHPVEGVYSEKPGCTQWHSKGVYGIPYRALYSRNIANLFLGGRLISASHIAFGSTRVMATCAHNGQAVGLAAALCLRHRVDPRQITEPARMAELQRELLRAGQYLPGVALDDPEDLVRSAEITASSAFVLDRLPSCGRTVPLDDAWAMMLPVGEGALPEVTFLADAVEDTVLEVELRVSSRPENHTPDVTLETVTVPVAAGRGVRVPVRFSSRVEGPRYAFICLMSRPGVSIHLSERRVTGVLALAQKFNRAVATSPRQEPPAGSGIDSFEFWLPQRRPGGLNLALEVEPPLACFGPEQVRNGWARPVRQPNAWVPAADDAAPRLELRWSQPRTVARIELSFDTDFDHPMESVIMGHPERVMPFCVADCVVRDAEGRAVAEIRANHQTRRTITLSPPVRTTLLTLELAGQPGGELPSVFEVRCYGESQDKVDSAGVV